MTALSAHPRQLDPANRTVGDPGPSALRAAGPLAIVALVAFVASLVTTGGEEIALATSPLGIAASLAGLAALVALVIGTSSLPASRPALGSGVGRVGWLIALVGTVLAAGGQWAQLFALPGIATAAPALLRDGISSVVAGYIASYVVLATGWLLVGVSLLRSGTERRAVVWLIIVGALLCVAPLPVRFALLVLGASLLAWRGRDVGLDQPPR